jgi:hypothetical protein
VCRASAVITAAVRSIPALARPSSSGTNMGNTVEIHRRASFVTFRISDARFAD